MRDINIHPVLNGYVVTVGCQTVVFGGKLALVRALESYLENPEKIEKQYLTEAVNPMVVNAATSQEIRYRADNEVEGIAR